MNLVELVENYWDEGVLYFILVTGIIQISPIKLNPWSWLAKKIGNELNSDVSKEIKALDEKIDGVQKSLNIHIKTNEYDNATHFRQRVLRFNDEIMQDTKHTQEHYLEILKDIDDYEKFCKKHPDFPNNQAKFAIQNIKDTYKRCLQNKDFL